jgi:hypothetical protein
MRRKKKILIPALTCSLFLVLSAIFLSGTAVIEEVGAGEIDWETGVIRVVGYGAAPKGVPGAIGRLLAQRAAKADAYRNALEVIEGVRVRSETLVQNYTVVSDEIRLSMEGFIRGGHFEQVSYDMENTCEIILVLPLGGEKGLSSLLFNTVKQLPTIPTAPPVEVLPKPARGYTGIVIDTRGLDIKPALYPQVFDIDGYLLYGPTMVSVDRADFSTMVAYSRSLEKGLAMPRVGENPLLIKAADAVRSKGGEATDIVLGSEAATLFRQAVAGTDLLARASVVFIID